MIGCKGRRGRTDESVLRGGIDLLNGPGVGEKFLAGGDVAGGRFFAVEQLVVEGFEGGNGAADGEAGELGAGWIMNRDD